MYRTDFIKPTISEQTAGAYTQGAVLVSECIRRDLPAPSVLLDTSGNPLTITVDVARSLSRLGLQSNNYADIVQLIAEAVEEFTSSMVAGHIACKITYQTSVSDMADTVKEGRMVRHIAFTQSGGVLDTGTQGRQRHLTMGAGSYKMDDAALFMNALNSQKHVMCELTTQSAQDTVKVDAGYSIHDLAQAARHVATHPETLSQLIAETAQQKLAAATQSIRGETITSPLQQIIANLSQTNALPQILVDRLLASVPTPISDLTLVTDSSVHQHISSNVQTPLIQEGIQAPVIESESASNSPTTTTPETPTAHSDPATASIDTQASPTLQAHDLSPSAISTGIIVEGLVHGAEMIDITTDATKSTKTSVSEGAVSTADVAGQTTLGDLNAPSTLHVGDALEVTDRIAAIGQETAPLPVIGDAILHSESIAQAENILDGPITNPSSVAVRDVAHETTIIIDLAPPSDLQANHHGDTLIIAEENSTALKDTKPSLRVVDLDYLSEHVISDKQADAAQLSEIGGSEKATFSSLNHHNGNDVGEAQTNTHQAEHGTVTTLAQDVSGYAAHQSKPDLSNTLDAGTTAKVEVQGNNSRTDAPSTTSFVTNEPIVSSTTTSVSDTILNNHTSDKPHASPQTAESSSPINQTTPQTEQSGAYTQQTTYASTVETASQTAASSLNNGVADQATQQEKQRTDSIINKVQQDTPATPTQSGTAETVTASADQAAPARTSEQRQSQTSATAETQQAAADVTPSNSSSNSNAAGTETASQTAANPETSEPSTVATQQQERTGGTETNTHQETSRASETNTNEHTADGSNHTQQAHNPASSPSPEPQHEPATPVTQAEDRTPEPQQRQDATGNSTETVSDATPSTDTPHNNADTASTPTQNGNDTTPPPVQNGTTESFVDSQKSEPPVPNPEAETNQSGGCGTCKKGNCGSCGLAFNLMADVPERTPAEQATFDARRTAAEERHRATENVDHTAHDQRQRDYLYTQPDTTTQTTSNTQTEAVAGGCGTCPTGNCGNCATAFQNQAKKNPLDFGVFGQGQERTATEQAAFDARRAAAEARRQQSGPQPRYKAA